MDQDPTPLLYMRGMTKSFGPVQAVVDVDLVLHKGEILGVVGDNAAGKSTLMKLLTGVHQQDEGVITLEGKRVTIDSPHKARTLGIEMIYQDFSLSPNLSVVDNVFLGREATRSFLGLPVLDRKRMREVSLEVIGETGVRLESANTVVTDLSGGQQQAVAIARALAFDAKIIIMDEPTASLSVKAIPPLLELMAEFRAAGKSMIFITHRIQDIFSTCDRVMVLRRGRALGESSIENTTVDEVTNLITGQQEAFGTLPDHKAH